MHLQTKVLITGLGFFFAGLALYWLADIEIPGVIMGFGGILGSMFIVEYGIKKPVKKKATKVIVRK